MNDDLSLDDLYRRKFRRELLLKKMVDYEKFPEHLVKKQREMIEAADWEIKLRLDDLHKEMEQERVELDNL